MRTLLSFESDPRLKARDIVWLSVLCLHELVARGSASGAPARRFLSGRVAAGRETGFDQTFDTQKFAGLGLNRPKLVLANGSSLRVSQEHESFFDEV